MTKSCTVAACRHRSAGLRDGRQLAYADPMKFGARNQIEATVGEIKTGDVMSQVELRVDHPAIMSSVMTSDSLRDLGLKSGDKVRVIVKAIHVLVVRD